MIYWLRIIFLSILSLLVFQSMEENVISAYMTDTCAENILSDTDKIYHSRNHPQTITCYGQ